MKFVKGNLVLSGLIFQFTLDKIAGEETVQNCLRLIQIRNASLNQPYLFSNYILKSNFSSLAGHTSVTSQLETLPGKRDIFQ